MSVFAQALGGAFAQLPKALLDFHAGAAQRQFAGHATIEHGAGFAAKIGITLGRFPPPGQDIPLTVTISQTGQGERWVRDFDGHITESFLQYDPKRQQIIEKLGLVTCALSLVPLANQLHVNVIALRVFGLAVPTPLIPRSTSREWQDDSGAFRFDIGAQMPGGGALIRYHGSLVPQV